MAFERHVYKHSFKQSHVGLLPQIFKMHSGTEFLCLLNHYNIQHDNNAKARSLNTWFVKVEVEEFDWPAQSLSCVCLPPVTGLLE